MEAETSDHLDYIAEEVRRLALLLRNNRLPKEIIVGELLRQADALAAHARCTASVPFTRTSIEAIAKAQAVTPRVGIMELAAQ
jgi:hypothetical protein